MNGDRVLRLSKALFLAVILFLAALVMFGTSALAEVDKKAWTDRFQKLGCNFAGAMEMDGKVSAWGVVTDTKPLADLGFKEPAKGMVLKLKPMGDHKYQTSLGFRGPGVKRQKMVLELN